MTREEARELVNELVEVHTYGPNIEVINKVEQKIIAALAPAPSPDDVALVDELRLCAYAYGNGGGDKDREDMEAARTALLGRLAATSRDAVIEECARVARSYEPKCDTCPSGVENAIRALKGK